MNTIIVGSVIFVIGFLRSCNCQYSKGSQQYNLLKSTETDSLSEELKSLPDLNLYFNPDRGFIFNDGYSFNFPIVEDYRIGIIIDPCRGLNNNSCCMNVFGTPEYPSLRLTGLEQERVLKYPVIGTPEEVSSNYDLIYEDSSAVPVASKRFPDDDQVIDPACINQASPHSYCMGKQFALKRSALNPACTDNNSTLNVLAGCYYPNNTYSSHCVQVAYTQSAFIPLCVDDSDPHCGTFLEIHQSQGSYYTEENDLIGEVRLEPRNVSGYYTTVLPLLWMKDPKKILCTYTESTLRIGSMVYIMNNAPVCCCVRPYKAATRFGSFQCPKGSGTYGAWAADYKVLADRLAVDVLSLKYPYCPVDLDSGDLILCSGIDVSNQREYIKECSLVYKSSDIIENSWTSDELIGNEYSAVCPYNPSCAITVDAGKCKGDLRGDDLKYTFIGYVGRVTKLDNRAAIPQVWVTFNDGRTSYQFDQEMVSLERYKSMYEIWWVIRTPSEFIVQKRKGFNITSPLCTFDKTNDRYFPYTMLDDGDNIIREYPV